MNSITRRSIRISCTRSAVSWLRVLLIGCALLLQIGCSTYSGIAEFSSYRDAWSRASDVGEDVLDRLAVAERGIYETGQPDAVLKHPLRPLTREFLARHHQFAF